MDAQKLFIDKEDKYLYLERYVNNGSPSGFHLRTTSFKTNPATGDERFPLLEFSDADIECIHLGNKHELFERGVNYAHPDSSNSSILEKAGRTLLESNLVVSPTSGGRTMLIRPPSVEGFVKLTYDVARIGRVDRQLTLKHCLTCLEVTKSMKKCIDDGKLPTTFSLLLEESSKVTVLKMEDGVYEWGVIYREAKPYPYSIKNAVLIPGFSLFGKDSHSTNDELLINQLIELSNSNPRVYLVNLLKLITDCYWGVVLNCAFHLELHAQNCLFEVDDKYNIVRMVVRDMDSVDKDIPLAKHFGFKHDWESYPIMCFDESIYFYPIRASYMYDFKLGQYLFSPLINVVAAKYNLDIREIEKEIREYVQLNYTRKMPPNYFPSDGCWYDCDNTERKPGEKRKYFAHESPKFR